MVIERIYILNGMPCFYKFSFSTVGSVPEPLHFPGRTCVAVVDGVEPTNVAMSFACSLTNVFKERSVELRSDTGSGVVNAVT